MSMEPKTYVVCVAATRTGVVFVHKKRPAWQAGYFNFPGGKIESGETPSQAAAREFDEECLVQSEPHDWSYIGEIVGDDADGVPGRPYCVYIMRARFVLRRQPDSGTDEHVGIHSLSYIFRHRGQYVANVPVIVAAIIARCKVSLDYRVESQPDYHLETEEAVN